MLESVATSGITYTVSTLVPLGSPGPEGGTSTASSDVLVSWECSALPLSGGARLQARRRRSGGRSETARAERV